MINQYDNKPLTFLPSGDHLHRSSGPPNVANIKQGPCHLLSSQVLRYLLVQWRCDPIHKNLSIITKHRFQKKKGGGGESYLILVSMVVQMFEVTTCLHVAAPARVQLKIFDASFLILQLEVCIDSQKKCVEKSKNNCKCYI